LVGVPRVVAYVPDLMDRSKVAAAAPGATFVPAPGDLAGAGADVIVVDLERPGVLDAVRDVGPARTVAFARHTSTELMAAAREAGVDVVVARSQFFGRVGDYLG
jgi:hypothetical protein